MEETESRKGKGGAVAIAALLLMTFGGWVVPKVWDAGSNAYHKQRQRILLSEIGKDLEGKAFDVDPQRKRQMIAPMMEREDLLKALYVLDLRYRQQTEVIDGIRNAAQWDGMILGDE